MNYLLRQQMFYFCKFNIIFIWCPLIAILAANERISKTIGKSPETLSIIFEDFNTFISNTDAQISFVATSSLDIAIEAVRKDLEDIDMFLGVPLQQRLTLETGLDMALDNLLMLKEETAKVSMIVSELQTDCHSAKNAAMELRQKIEQIRHHLFTIQQQCNLKDRPVCFAIQFSGYDRTTSISNLSDEAKIPQLGQYVKEDTFNSSVDSALKNYKNIPSQVAEDTSSHVTEIKSILSGKRTLLYKSTRELNNLARKLSQEVTGSQKAIFTLLDNVVKWDLWRWLAILVVILAVALIWSFLLCGASCGCPITSNTLRILQVSLGLLSITSLFVWTIGAAALFIGGFGQVWLCKPLHDYPRFTVLSTLLNSEGTLYGNEGLLGDFGRKNESIKVAEVLKSCHRDQTAYDTFHLDGHLDIEETLNYDNWNDIKKSFESFLTAKTEVEILSPALQVNLQILSSNTASNLSMLRQEISRKFAGKDLESFADQLNNIARQLLDPIISRRVDNLAFSVRNVVQQEMQKLNDLRGRILYKVTTLEVLLPPLNGKVNQSLSHLKTIQFFLDNQGWKISESVRQQFIGRIETYLKELYGYASRKMTKEIGKCRSLWEIFHATRFHICKLLVDPLNMIAFASFFLIWTFLGIVPVIVKLLQLYNNDSDTRLATSPLYRGSRQGLISNQDRVWMTPSTGSPEELEIAPTSWISPPPSQRTSIGLRRFQ
ncbi:hypothetical protein ABEB36_014793 [Hypothenemus hampei]|uniref:Prominin-1-A n=1 Tax=Hypothenemus hampei TaxID=57062 RepID=A0ABD1E3L5_HYPHA